ncbi:hypothetical protein D3C80_2217720 [compost metagenome]
MVDLVDTVLRLRHLVGVGLGNLQQGNAGRIAAGVQLGGEAGLDQGREVTGDVDRALIQGLGQLDVG